MNAILGTTASSQSKFVTRYSYGLWFNGTNSAYGGMNLGSKLYDSDWLGNYGVDNINLFFDSITINNVTYVGGIEIFFASDPSFYTFRNDGYGVGFSSYVDQLNIILRNYKLRTRFYPAGGNAIVGVVNTAENFEVYLPELAFGPDVQTDYKIKCVYGTVEDTIFGSFDPLAPVIWS